MEKTNKKMPIVFKVCGDDFGNYSISYGKNVHKMNIVEDFIRAWNEKEVKLKQKKE